MLNTLKLLPLLFLLSSINVYAETVLKVADARVMVTPPGVSVTAALMTLLNVSGSELTISSISADGFERVEMHKTEVTDGIARMTHEQQVTIPANGTLVLENGGFHLMLYAPERSFTEGDSVEITLTTNKGVVTASVPVTRHDAR